MRNPYSENFYTDRSTSLKSADVIIDFLLEIYKPESVVDIGCGTGDFLNAFMGKGVKDICGYDGIWVPKEYLKIPTEKFHSQDITKPIINKSKYDLAVSLEVGEHIEEGCVGQYLDNIQKMADVILFSAAIPGQGGVHHVNEQWPEYWIEKFGNLGFDYIDCLRDKLWENENVNFWYAQNILVFVRKDELKRIPNLKRLWRKKKENIRRVHPKLYMSKIQKLEKLYKFLPFRFIKKLFSCIQ